MEADIVGLRKVIDDTNISRMNLESEIEALKEELIHLKKNHDNVSMMKVKWPRHNAKAMFFFMLKISAEVSQILIMKPQYLCVKSLTCAVKSVSTLWHGE